MQSSSQGGQSESGSFRFSVCVQGGIYQFQLIDYYAANGACLLFLSAVQCVAVGWAFGRFPLDLSCVCCGCFMDNWWSKQPVGQ